MAIFAGHVALGDEIVEPFDGERETCFKVTRIDRLCCKGYVHINGVCYRVGERLTIRPRQFRQEWRL